MNIRNLVEGLRTMLGSGSAGPAPETRNGAETPTNGASTGAARDLLKSYQRQASAAPHWGEVKPREYEAGRAILEADEPTQIAVIRAALEWMSRDRGMTWDSARWTRWLAVRGLLNQLLARRLPLTEPDLQQMLELVLSCARRGAFTGQSLVASHAEQLPLRRILRQVEWFAAQHGLPGDIRSLLERLRPRGLAGSEYADDKDYADRIDLLLGKAPSEQERAAFAPDEPWSTAALADLAAMEEPVRTAWQSLLLHARDSDGPRPSRKWLQEARSRMTGIGEAVFTRQMLSWLARAGEPARMVISDQNSALLKGLVWCCSLLSDDGLCRAVGALGEACFKKIPDHGPRSERVGNACIYALGAMTCPEAVAQLTRLRRRARYRAAQETIRKALDAAAQRTGLSPEELEELTVPTYGLDEQGRLEEPVGAYTSVIAITGSEELEWTWRTPEGKPQKSVPAEVTQHHAEELKALKQTVAEIEKMMPAQRERVEALLRGERSWPLAAWRERYLDHPLLAGITRRLIWRFQQGDHATLGIFRDGQLVDAADRPLDGLTDDTRVSLWHPIGCDPEEVLRWRQWLEAHEVTQPFKQAHREVYLLTDAERVTDTYSNRFAAHILKQHQFKALCDQKGWRYRLQGGFDGGDPSASLPLPQWGLTAEFWVDIVGEEGDALSGAGINLYITTDQVRFTAPDGEPRSLTEVPTLAFTEVMRDVDLFVSVASVGNDPTWADTGGEPGYRGYWQSYAFGDLSATAQTRRELLTRLLPRLKIAARCSLDGRFLKVRGDLRTYKIHLGSGNILMEPNDQYLCIVPGRGFNTKDNGGSLFLPFEGDRTLSVILSKAFLLAEDTKIKDPTILSQINRR